MTTDTTSSIGELYAALAAARLEFADITKRKEVKTNTYQYKYADLAAVIDAIAEPLAKHGLSLIQEPEITMDGGKMQAVVHGVIVHKSGASYQLRPLPMPVAQATPQGIGSAISYARRYQTIAAFNLAAEDDDGTEAQKTGQARPEQSERDGVRTSNRTAPAAKTQEATSTPVEKPSEAMITEAQTKELHSLGVAYYADKWDEERRRIVMHVSVNAVESSKELTQVQAGILITGLEKGMRKRIITTAETMSIDLAPILRDHEVDSLESASPVGLTHIWKDVDARVKAMLPVAA